MNDSTWVAVNAAKYQTTLTAVRQTALSWQQILIPNPRRVYLRFFYSQPGVGTSFVMRGPGAGSTGSFSGTNLPFEVKYKDDPSGITGAWVMFVAPGVDLIIEETTYVGE